MAEEVLEIPLRSQELTLWCWAAIASALSAVIPGATPLAPCAIASQLTTDGNCCADPDACNKARELDPPLRIAGVGFIHTEERSFGSIRDAITIRGRPVAARIEDNDTGRGHFVLVVGCDDATPNTIVCADPNGTPGFPAPRYRMKYSDFDKSYGGWGHCTDFFLIQ
jgi:hypothetical protein